MMRPLNRYDYYVSSNVELIISPNSIIYPPLWRNGTNMNQTHIGDLGTIFGLSSSIAGTSYTNVNPAMKHALSRWALWMWTINSLMHSEFTERILSCHIIFRMWVLISLAFNLFMWCWWNDSMDPCGLLATGRSIITWSWTLKFYITGDLLPCLGMVWTSWSKWYHISRRVRAKWRYWSTYLRSPSNQRLTIRLFRLLTFCATTTGHSQFNQGGAILCSRNLQMFQMDLTFVFRWQRWLLSIQTYVTVTQGPDGSRGLPSYTAILWLIWYIDCARFAASRHWPHPI